jgi:hypothetical protein
MRRKDWALVAGRSGWPHDWSEMNGRPSVGALAHNDALDDVGRLGKQICVQAVRAVREAGADDPENGTLSVM